MIHICTKHHSFNIVINICTKHQIHNNYQKEKNNYRWHILVISFGLNLICMACCAIHHQITLGRAMAYKMLTACMFFQFCTMYAHHLVLAAWKAEGWDSIHMLGHTMFYTPNGSELNAQACTMLDTFGICWLYFSYIFKLSFWCSQSWKSQNCHAV